MAKRRASALDIVFCIVLGLFWSWNWIIYQSPTSLVIELGPVALPSRFALLLAFAVTGFALFLMRYLGDGGTRSRRRARRYALAFALGAVILASDLADGSFDGELAGAPFAVQSVAMGAASAFLYAEIGELFGSMGATRLRFISTAAIAALVICVPVQMSLYWIGGNAREGLMVAFLVLAPPVLDRLRRHYGLKESRKVERARIPVKFVLTLVLAGLALGMLQGIFTQITAGEGHSALNPLSSIGFLLAAGAAAVVVFRGRFDFNRLIYHTGIPLLALGFTLVALNGNAFVGFILCVAGYYMTQVVLWVLCVYLATQSRGMVRWLFALMGCMMALGQGVGLISIDTFLYGLDHEASVLMSTSLLLACLFMSTSASPYESWGMVRPAEHAVETDIDTACATLALENLLTARETEILPYLAQGRSRKVIAEKLVLSENTIKTYISNVYSKLGVHTQQELIDLVQEKGREAADAPARL